MSSEAQRFAERVISALKQAGHHTDQEVVDAGGPSTTTMTKLRSVAKGDAEMPQPRGDVLKRIDAAAGWEPGSARALWHDGTEPVPLKPRVDFAWADDLSDRAAVGILSMLDDISTRLNQIEADLRETQALTQRLIEEEEQADGTATSRPGLRPVTNEYEEGLAADDGDGLTIEEEQGYDEHP